MGLDPILERSVLEVFVLDPSDLRILEASRAAFQNLGYQIGSLPVAEKMAKEVISLPMGSHLSQEEQIQVIEVCKG